MKIFNATRIVVVVSLCSDVKSVNVKIIRNSKDLSTSTVHDTRVGTTAASNMPKRIPIKYYRYEFLGRRIPSFNLVGPQNDKQAKEVLRWYVRPFLRCIPVFAGDEED